MTRIRIITGVLGTALLAACTKDAIQQLGAPSTGSYVKFYNFGINGPSVNFFANEVKVTAISSTSCTPISDPKCTSTGIESTNGTAYGSLGNAGLYSNIAPGSYAFSGRISATTDYGLSVAKITSTLTDGKYYSVYTDGFYDATGKVMDAFVLQDDFSTTIDFTTTAVRFVNASPNSTPMTLWAKNTVTGDSVSVGANIAYKAGGAFLNMVPAVYDLTTRFPGSTTPVIVRAGVSFVAGHVYTISARGDMTVVSTTATNRPFLDNTANR